MIQGSPERVMDQFTEMMRLKKREFPKPARNLYWERRRLTDASRIGKGSRFSISVAISSSII